MRRFCLAPRASGVLRFNTENQLEIVTISYLRGHDNSLIYHNYRILPSFYRVYHDYLTVMSNLESVIKALPKTDYRFLPGNYLVFPRYRGSRTIYGNRLPGNMTPRLVHQRTLQYRMVCSHCFWESIDVAKQSILKDMHLKVSYFH